jgi:hypothetical protein
VFCSEHWFRYTEKQFEDGKTHDKLWNAAQLQMVRPLNELEIKVLLHFRVRIEFDARHVTSRLA